MKSCFNNSKIRKKGKKIDNDINAP